MAYNLKSEEDVKDYLKNLGIEYRFGCYNEKNPEVCHLLGDYLEGIKKEYEKALAIFRNNCDEFNYAKSCYKYGVYRMLGKGGQKEDVGAAYQYFKKGCGLGDMNSCLSQGLLMLSNNEKMGVKRDVPEAFSLIEKSCMNNNANACFFISGLYITGFKNPDIKANPNKDDPKDYIIAKNMKKAFDLTQKGCELGNMYCCGNLSRMYKKGDGVEKNMELYEKYKKMAVEMQDDVSSQKSLTFQEGLT